MTALAFEIIKVGHCIQNERMACRSAPWRTSPFPALVGLIRHPTLGTIMFDTGYAPRFSSATSQWPERLYRMATPMVLPDNERLPVQLAARGIAPSDIGTIVVSHFHADHVCGLADFPMARFICARAGLDQIRVSRGLSGVRHGLLPTLVPNNFESRANFVEDAEELALPDDMTPFTHGRDILGDRTLIAVPLPGHAAGQFGLLFTADIGKRVLLAADGAFSMRAIRENARPMALANTLLGHSPAYAETLRRLHELNRRNSDVVIIPAHCTERMRELVR